MRGDDSWWSWIRYSLMLVDESRRRDATRTAKTRRSVGAGSDNGGVVMKFAWGLPVGLIGNLNFCVLDVHTSSFPYLAIGNIEYNGSKRASPSTDAQAGAPPRPPTAHRS